MRDALDRSRDEIRAKVLWIAIGAVTWGVVGVFAWHWDSIPVAILAIGIVQLLVGLIDLGVHRVESDDLPAGARAVRVRYVEDFATIAPQATCAALDRAIERWPDQPLVPVVDAQGGLCGLVEVDLFRELEAERDRPVADVMRSPVAIGERADARRALMLYDLRAIPIIDRRGRVARLAIGAETAATPADRARRE